jgi:hypothetical protein
LSLASCPSRFLNKLRFRPVIVAFVAGVFAGCDKSPARPSDSDFVRVTLCCANSPEGGEVLPESWPRLGITEINAVFFDFGPSGLPVATDVTGEATWSFPVGGDGQTVVLNKPFPCTANPTRLCRTLRGFRPGPFTVRADWNGYYGAMSSRVVE